MILSKFGQLFNYARTEKSKGRQFDGIGEGHGAHHGARHSALYSMEHPGVYIYVPTAHIFQYFRDLQGPKMARNWPENARNGPKRLREPPVVRNGWNSLERSWNGFTHVEANIFGTSLG